MDDKKETGQPEKQPEKKFYLDEEHVRECQKIFDQYTLKRYQKGKPCKMCGGSRNVGKTPEGSLIVCGRCVNIFMAERAWHEYCKKNPELLGRYYDNDKK